MKLAAHEFYDLQELILSCVNSITNMAYFRRHARDPEFKAIVEKHFALHVQDYNMKVEYVAKAQGSTSKLPVPELTDHLKSYTAAPTAPVAVTPRTDVVDFDDREMATAYLLTLKRAGREYAWGAMEAANPEVRSFLEDAFRMCSRHAFEVWQFMVEKGWYPLEPAPDQTLATAAQTYQIVREPVGVR